MINQIGLSMDDFKKLNSATKYPSIETHHVLGDRGGLTEDLGPFAGYEGDVVMTEKVNGTNGRIILLPDGDFFIGSREELLYAKGDRVLNSALSIVDTLLPVAESLHGDGALDGSSTLQVFYFEVYGLGIGPDPRQYTSSRGVTGLRLFDIAFIPDEVLTWDRPEIAARRDRNDYQRWAQEYVLGRAAEQEGVMLTPRRGIVDSQVLPTSVEGMAQWLETTAQSLAVLDATGKGRSEGLVLRSPDRKVIAKARLEDYERTLKRRNQPQGKRR